MNRYNTFLKKFLYGIFAVIFWIFIWHILANEIDSVIFLPTPEQTFKALLEICGREGFKLIIRNSFFRIIKGFLLALFCGTVLALLANFIKLVEILLSPMMKLIKAVPVASFIILSLLWIKSENLATLISFMMVLPVIYINLLQALKGIDVNMLEVAKVFNISMGRRIRYIYIPNILPALIAGCKIGLGFSFKSGIAAEIIGLPNDSIGWELYQSKLYLMTEEMFAWTVVIIFISIFFEGICIYLLNVLSKNLLKTGKNKYLKEDNHNKNNVGEGNKKVYTDINLVNISKSYDREQVLKDINIRFGNDRPVCIMGESGVGKTTLIRIILGLTKQDFGDIENIEDLTKSAVFQEDRLIENIDVYTNLYFVLGKRFSRSVADKYLEEIGLEGIGNKAVCELSGGMKRRVAIVRAILTDSDIIIMDEAFKGLDENTKELTINYVKKYCRRKILILITHDNNECEKLEGRIEVLNYDFKNCKSG